MVVVQEVPEDPTKAIWSDESATQGNARGNCYETGEILLEGSGGDLVVSNCRYGLYTIISLLIIDFFDSHKHMFIFFT